MPKDSYLLSIFIPTSYRIDYAFEKTKQLLTIKDGLSLWFFGFNAYEKQLIAVPLKKIFSTFKI